MALLGLFRPFRAPFGAKTVKWPYLELREELQPLLGGLLLGLGGGFDRFMTFPTRGYAILTDFWVSGPVFGPFRANFGQFRPQNGPKMTKNTKNFEKIFLLKITF